MKTKFSNFHHLGATLPLFYLFSLIFELISLFKGFPGTSLYSNTHKTQDGYRQILNTDCNKVKRDLTQRRKVLINARRLKYQKKILKSVGRLRIYRQDRKNIASKED